jgi:hypothetical protein
MSPASSRRGPVRPILLVALAIVLTIIAWHTVAAIFIPLFWLAVVVAGVVLVSRSARTRHDR